MPFHRPIALKFGVSVAAKDYGLKTRDCSNRVTTVGLPAKCETFKGGRPSSAGATDREDVLVVERVLRIGERNHRREVVAECSAVDAGPLSPPTVHADAESIHNPPLRLTAASL